MIGQLFKSLDVRLWEMYALYVSDFNWSPKHGACLIKGPNQFFVSGVSLFILSNN